MGEKDDKRQLRITCSGSSTLPLASLDPFQGTLKELSRGEVCCDPFAGSGSQIVMAETLSRKCYALEIIPAYCAVIIERMKKTFPGIKIEKE